VSRTHATFENDLLEAILEDEIASASADFRARDEVDDDLS
jgi:hypothetical protein